MMLATLLWSGGGLLTSLAGIWIAAMFVPSIAVLLKATLDFVRSPIGTLIAIAGLCLFLFVSGWIGGDLHGSHETRAEWTADVEKKAKVSAARELTLRLEMKKTADAAIGTDDTFTKSIDQQVQKNEADKMDRPACRRATGADIGRLLSIH